LKPKVSSNVGKELEQLVSERLAMGVPEQQLLQYSAGTEKASTSGDWHSWDEQSKHH
jgi:hypothetical protein